MRPLQLSQQGEVPDLGTGDEAPLRVVIQTLMQEAVEFFARSLFRLGSGDFFDFDLS